MKQDEQELLAAMRERAALGERGYVRDVVGWLCLNDKRAAYILEKWTNKGWYDYGVNVFAGWLTDEGMNDHG